MSVFEQIGLTKLQIQGILEGEIKKLADQEKVMRGIIDKLANDSNEYHKKRDKAAEDFEKVRIEEAELLKKIETERSKLQNDKKKIAEGEQRVAILREKLEVEREQFKKDLAYQRETIKKAEIEQKRIFEVGREADAKLKGLDAQKDELTITQANVNKLMAELEVKEKDINSMSAALKSERLELQKLREDFEKKDAAILKLKDHLESETKQLKAGIEKDREKFNKEKNGIEEGLRHREHEIAVKEKVVSDMELTVKSRLESMEIEEGRKRRKKGA